MEKFNYVYKDYENLKFHSFWGSKSIYSNFYESYFNLDLTQPAVKYDNEYYFGNSYDFKCNEQYFMWRKATLFQDLRTADKILDLSLTPYQYKQLGRSVKNYDDNIWEKFRYEIMKEGLYLKFTQNDKLKQELLNTGDIILVETSPYDTIWGIGTSNKNILKNPNLWEGRNLLGFALMNVRDDIRAEERTNPVM